MKGCEDVPREVWEFRIGGYQGAEKWLKDPKGRVLSYDDITHYARALIALAETIRLMDEIDAHRRISAELNPNIKGKAQGARRAPLQLHQ